MGIVISALTGSEDPAEVSQMAKQASEVIYDYRIYSRISRPAYKSN